MKRWTCPTCNVGVNAPERMSADDARRFCLRCTSRSGKLVRRAMPSRATEAARRAAARAAATAKRQERAVARRSESATRTAALLASPSRPKVDGRDWLIARIPAILALKTWAEWAAAIRRGAVLGEITRWSGAPSITIRQGGVARAWASGRAWPGSQRLVMTTGPHAGEDLATLIHEIAHLVAPLRDHHSPRFRSIEADAIGELTGITPPAAERAGRPHCAHVKRWLDSQETTHA